MKIVIFATLMIAIVNFLSCSSVDSKESTSADREAFNDYWYAGKADLTRYALEQARYGEIHQGDAVLIFVTEDFRTDKQVKYEGGDRKNVTSVLKLNFTKKFNTGLYPYSLMTSVFTPADGVSPTLKVTSSSQEWCGHTFMQLNRRSGKFDVQLRSYFQDEGDQNFQLNTALLEDEVWTKIRLAPQSLPTGEIQIVPSQLFSRLRHVPLRVEKATATLTTTADPNSTDEQQVYTIDYKDIKRKLAIRFEKNFPHRIVAWEESNISGFGPEAKMLTTKAVKTHSILSDYWNRHTVADSVLRNDLGLSPD
ncbi:MAG TPA: septum formation inhibitor Maf [bacterium]